MHDPSRTNQELLEENYVLKQKIKKLAHSETERKRALEELDIIRNRLSKAEIISRSGNWEFDLESKRVFASDGARNVYGLRNVEWAIPDVQKIPLPEYRDLLDQALRNLINEGHPYDVEFKIRRPDTDEIVDIHSVAEYDKQRNVVFGIIQDITERKQSEEERAKLQAQLNQAQKMESIGRLAGGVAHDFNNILTAILGYTELAMNRCRPSDPIHNDLKIIENSALQSAGLVRQLLAFARKQTVAPKVLDLNDTVAGMLKMLQRLIGEDIKFGWMPGTGLWSLKIDPSQIDQLLANLFVNARDAITGVGKITIETGNMVFDKAYCDVHTGFVPGEYVMLTVSDDGFGMDRETIAQIFEPFFTTKERGKGTGLGLATVYGIVKQNGGFINVYSEPGNGSTFKIYLPRFLGEAVASVVARSLEFPKGCGETVLLVEDDAVILKLGSLMLEQLGYMVLIADTPTEALRLAKAPGNEINLLLTDVVMPEMNGRDLARLLKEMIPGLKCLFASGYTADVIAHHNILDEGVHFLEKPFSMKSLATKVRDALEGE